MNTERELTGKQWSAATAAFRKYADRYCHSGADKTVISDIAAQEIYNAILDALPPATADAPAKVAVALLDRWRFLSLVIESAVRHLGDRAAPDVMTLVKDTDKFFATTPHPQTQPSAATAVNTAEGVQGKTFVVIGGGDGFTARVVRECELDQAWIDLHFFFHGPLSETDKQQRDESLAYLHDRDNWTDEGRHLHVSYEDGWVSVTELDPHPQPQPSAAVVLAHVGEECLWDEIEQIDRELYFCQSRCKEGTKRHQKLTAMRGNLNNLGGAFQKVTAELRAHAESHGCPVCAALTQESSKESQLTSGGCYPRDRFSTAQPSAATAVNTAEGAYSAEELRDICERLQNGYISGLIADEKMSRKDYLAALEYIKRAMVDADQCIGYAITHGLFASPPASKE